MGDQVGRGSHGPRSCLWLGALALAGVAAAEEPVAEPVDAPEVVVVGVTPVMGTGVDKDKLPANVQTIAIGRGQRTAPTIGDALDRGVGSIATSNMQNNPWQPSLQFRGFTASPILGEPQALAVYEGGMRLNEPFGDVVHWDLIPLFAVSRIQILPGTNPVFGLNAVGGALALDLKDGFTARGGSAEVSGGSFGTMRAMGDYAWRGGSVALYGGLAAVRESGWRDLSPSEVLQGHVDVAARPGAHELGLGLTAASSRLTGNGPAPVELLALDRSSFFTAPDETRNRLLAANLRAHFAIAPTTSLQATAYYRRLRHATRNGDLSDFGECAASPGVLCGSPGEPDEEQLTDQSGNAVPVSAGGDAAVNRAETDTNGVGASLQASDDRTLGGRRNDLVVGASADLGFTRYRATSELATLDDGRETIGSGIQLGGDLFNTELEANTSYYGAYFSDTFSLLERVSVTAAGRLNHARVLLRDQLGTELDGEHRFTRFNPSIGLTWRALNGLTTYASYGEATRVPTPAELSCADPDRPCRVPNAFMSDPPLDQVVSRTVEVGARGRVPLARRARVDWSLALFRTRSADDIIFVSSGPVVGTGFFQNAGATLRQGLESRLDGKVGASSWFASYAFVRATFESALTIQSPHNPGADADGDIHVTRGDRVPGMPLHNLKLGASWGITDRWTLGAELVATSGRYLVGDEANLERPTGAFAVANLGTAYRVTRRLLASVRIENLLDRDYETAGTFGDPGELFATFANPRFLSPGRPFSVEAGVELDF